MTGNARKVAHFTLGGAVNDAKDEARLAFILDGRVILQINVDAGTLERMVESLAFTRAELTGDPVSPELDPNSRGPTDALRGATYQVWDAVFEDHPDEQARILSLRHPGYGWVSFLLDEEHSKKIAAHLTTPG